MSTDPRLPISLAEIDGDLRLLAETLRHITSPERRRDVHLRIDALRALRVSLVAQERAALAAWWLQSWPGTEPPGWPQSASEEGVGA